MVKIHTLVQKTECRQWATRMPGRSAPKVICPPSPLVGGTQNGGDTIFPIISQWELLVAMTPTVLIQSVPKSLCSLSPTSLTLHIKSDQDWPSGFRDIHVWKCRYVSNLFWCSRACNSKVTDPIQPGFELVWDFKPVLITSKFDEGPIKNECASLATPFSHYNTIRNFFKTRSRAPNFEGSGPIWPKFELAWDFMPVLVTCQFDKDRIKTEGISVVREPMRAFCCHGNHSFAGICSKTYKQPFPHPTDDTYKICSRSGNWSWQFHNKSVENLIHPQGPITPKDRWDPG